MRTSYVHCVEPQLPAAKVCPVTANRESVIILNKRDIVVYLYGYIVCTYTKCVNLPTYINIMLCYVPTNHPNRFSMPRCAADEYLYRIVPTLPTFTLIVLLFWLDILGRYAGAIPPKHSK